MKEYEIDATLTITYTKICTGTLDEILQDLGLDPGNPHHRKALKKSIEQSLSPTQKQEPLDNAIESIAIAHLKQFATDAIALELDAEEIKCQLKD